MLPLELVDLVILPRTFDVDVCVNVLGGGLRAAANVLVEITEVFGGCQARVRDVVAGELGEALGKLEMMLVIV